MLYDGTIRFLQQAMEAIRNEDAERRYDRLTRASEIILALKTALEPARGSAVARSLNEFYQSMDRRILAVHHTHNLAECADIVNKMREVRDLWEAIDRNEANRR